MICCHVLGAATFPSLKEPLCNVRFGSLADISQCNRHVRFTPESGHSQVSLECPLVPKAEIF